MKRHSLIALLLLGTGYSKSTQLAKRDEDEGPNAAAKKHGRWFGSAFDKDDLEDSQIMKFYNDPNFIGQITPANLMKPQFIDVGGGKFSFDGGDLMVAQAKKLNAVLRCHYLTGPNQNGASVDSLQDRDAALAYLDKYIGAVIKHYGSDCHSWDVVNEALTADGKVRTDDVWATKIGPDFVEEIFKIATKYAPKDVKLCYNDYNLEMSPDKLQGAIQLASKVKEAGARMDCIGFQSHVKTDYHPTLESYTSALSKAAAAVSEVPITELDVAVAAGASASAQGEVYAIAMKACFAVAACPGITVWGLKDKDKKYNPNDIKTANLFDENDKEKPAVQMILSALSSSTSVKPKNLVQPVGSDPTGSSTTSEQNGVKPKENGSTTTKEPGHENSKPSGTGPQKTPPDTNTPETQASAPTNPGTSGHYSKVNPGSKKPRCLKN